MTAATGVPARPPESLRAARALAPIVVVLSAALAYHNSFHGALVFDDQANVAENSTLRQLWPPWSALSPPAGAGVGGRPFANLTLALNYAVSGLHPWSYHALNLALHALTALGLLSVVRRTLLRPGVSDNIRSAAEPLALATAALWAIHPLTTAVVDYTSQRTEGLMGLCYVLTLLAFIRSVETGARAWQILAIAACALGMASKEVMVTAPVMVLLYDRTFVSGSLSAAWRERRGFYLALAASWLVLAGLMFGSPVAQRGVGFGLGVPVLDYALSECGAITTYLRLAVWPNPLVFDYGWDFARSAANAAPSVAFVSLAIAATWFFSWRRPMLGFAGVWFLGILAPTSSFVPVIQQPITESRMYLPLASVIALAVLGLHVVLRGRAWIAWVGLAFVSCTLTVQRNFDYADETSLWSDTVVKRPKNARAHNNLAGALLRAGHTDDALLHALAAIKLQPEHPDAHTNAGAALVQAGRAEEAIPHLEAALRRLPDSADAHFNLANALLRAGRGAEAIGHYEIALRFNPARVQAHNDLSVALLQAGRVAEALAHGTEAVRLDPNFSEARYNFGNALAQAGRLPEAIAQFEAAVRLKPDFAQARNNLGAVLLRSGRAAEAAAQFEAALKIRPDYPEARRNLEAARAAGAPR